MLAEIPETPQVVLKHLPVAIADIVVRDHFFERIDGRVELRLVITPGFQLGLKIVQIPLGLGQSVLIRAEPRSLLVSAR